MESQFDPSQLNIPDLDPVYVRVAGAQIPVGTDVVNNKIEILKAIDWAKENEVKHLLTPEGALSGYFAGWEYDYELVEDSLKEIEEHVKKTGINLSLGTNFKEKERVGEVFRNEIRHYNSNGQIMGATYKTYGLPMFESCLPRDPDEDIVVVGMDRPDDLRTNIPSIVGMLCNDMWGYMEGRATSPLTTKIKNLGGIDAIFHATNGRKFDKRDLQQPIFDAWHEGFFRMTAGNTLIPILTVDSCTPWDWHPNSKIEIDEYPTSSQSGLINYLGWQTDVPRHGRQYFYHDLDVSLPADQKFYKYCQNLQKEGKYFPKIY